MSRATSLVAREHELDRALHSLRFSGGVLITGEAGAGKTFLAACIAERLTQRETGVTQLPSRGLSDREIAVVLVLSIRTVQSHLASAYRKLGIASRSGLKR